MEAATIFDLMFRGVAMGALASVGVGLARGGANVHVRIAGVLFSLSTTAYVITSSPLLREAIGPGMPPVWTLSVSGAGYTWLFLYVLFEDARLTPKTLAPPGLLLLIGLIAYYGPQSAAPTVWIIHNLVEASLAVHALFFIARSWRDDLVEERRRLRGPFLATVAIYMMVLSSFEISEALGGIPRWHQIAGSASLALFCLGGAVAFLTLRPGLFGRAAPAAANIDVDAPVSGGDAQDRVIAERLTGAMDADALWKREGLTIGMLADTLGVPEHRVRRVINGHLGHRNFAAFVNTHRIAAAKTALGAPENAGRTIAAIAFDLGFGSLGPFNRAFKEATGLTPTEFRAQALQSASPKPENPR